MKKKMTGLLLTVAMAVSMAGCGAKNDTTAATETTAAETTAAEVKGGNDGEFPSKQISIICPYSAGGAADTVSRAVAAEMQNTLGVPVVVVNKTGAAGGSFPQSRPRGRGRRSSRRAAAHAAARGTSSGTTGAGGRSPRPCCGRSPGRSG